MKSRPRVDNVKIEWTDEPTRPLLWCEAVAEVSYAIEGTNGDRRVEWLHSGGLGGIDKHSSPRYLHEIELDELANLSVHLEHFGIIESPLMLNKLIKR